MNIDLKSADQFWNDFIKKIKTLEEAQKEVETKYQACDEERKTLKASLETANHEKIAVNKTCQDLKDVLQTTENEKHLLTEECKKLKSSLNAANEKIGKLEKECSRSELSHSEVLNENAILKNALNEAKNANLELTKKCNDLTLSLNNSIIEINSVKTKFKRSSKIIKKLEKEMKMAHENQQKIKELFDSSWCSPSKTISEVVLSDDDENELSSIPKNPQSDEKVNSQKVLSVEGSEKKVSIKIHERSDIVAQSSSDKEISHLASPVKKNDLLISSRITSPVTPPSPHEQPKAGISDAGNEDNCISPASACRTQSNQSISAFSPRRDVLNTDLGPIPSNSKTEDKSKTTPRPTKTAPTPVSVANSQSKDNQTVVVVSSTSPRNQYQAPVLSIKTKIKSTSSNDGNEISNRATSPSVVNVLKKSILSANVISSQEDNCGIRHVSVSPMSDKLSFATSSLLKSNEADNRSSPVLNASSLQKKLNQAVSIVSSKSDDLKSDSGLVSSISLSLENQSTAKSVSPEEKSDSTCAIPDVSSQSEPAIVPVVPCSPVATNNHDTSNKDQNHDSLDEVINSQINQNFVSTPPTRPTSPKFPSPFKTQKNVSSSLPMSGSSRASRSSMLLFRAKDRGCQREPLSRQKSKIRSVAGSDCFTGWDRSNKECDKIIGLQSDSIAKNSAAKENKEPVGDEIPDDLMMRHFSNLRESLGKTSASSEGSNFDISCPDSEDNSSAPPSPSEGSVSIPERRFSSAKLMKYPFVSIPRIDEISEEALYQEMNSSREAETNKQASIGGDVRSSKKRRSSSVPSEQLPKKSSQRVTKPKTLLYLFSCSKCSVQFACNSDLNRHIFRKHHGSKTVEYYKIPMSPRK